VASGSPSFTILAAAVEAANLTSTLDDPELEVTLFAPTDRAFRNALKALDMTAAQLLDDTDLLTNVLLLHVVPEAIPRLSSMHEEVTTLLMGETLKLWACRSSAAKIYAPASRARVLDDNGMEACSAFVYPIDTVLLPSDFLMRDDEDIEDDTMPMTNGGAAMKSAGRRLV
jgi:uncharacterized surface protein with fasciclin (FAS1) repeats